MQYQFKVFDWFIIYKFNFICFQQCVRWFSRVIFFIIHFVSNGASKMSSSIDEGSEFQCLIPVVFIWPKKFCYQVRSNHLSKQIIHVTPFQLTRQIFRKEGIFGLISLAFILCGNLLQISRLCNYPSYRFYRGLTPTLYREMPGYFFFFGGYEYTREFLKRPDQKKEDIGLLKTMMAGSVGGICLWTVIFPADVMKSRMQVNNVQMNMFTFGANIVRNEGVGALYTGLKPTLIRTIPSTAVLFAVVSSVTDNLHKKFG